MTPKRGQRLIPETNRKKNFIGVRLTDEEFVALEKISKRQKLPGSHYVREGIALVIERYSKKR
ncbi:MAG: ribbon-helix-helix domain-containing protein [Terriglobia bacterium]